MDGVVIARWVQAIGSAGSLLAFAAWVGLAVINRRDEFEARFERQAQTVAAWLDEDERGDDGYAVYILNGGDSPVYRCQAALQGLTQRGQNSVVTAHLVPPHTTVARPTPASVDRLSWEQVYASGIAPELSFFDTSGRRWFRDREGTLALISARRRLRPRRPSSPRRQGSNGAAQLQYRSSSGASDVHAERDRLTQRVE